VKFFLQEKDTHMTLFRLALVGAALLVTACSEKEELGDAAAGRALAERNCQGCHAIGATGESPVVAAPSFREMVKRWPPEYLAESLAEGIEVGHSGQVDMPNFSFEPKQIDDLIAYLNTLDPKS
jgi:mono/diheme cytochrome c family protein